MKTREKREKKGLKEFSVGFTQEFIHCGNRELKPKIRLMKSIVGMVKGSMLATVSSETIGWEYWDEAMKLGRFEVCPACPVEGGLGERSGEGVQEKKKEEVSKKNKKEE